MKISDGYQTLPVREAILCAGGCGKVIFAVAPSGQGDTFRGGYNVQRPFALFPGLTCLVEKTTLPDGTETTITESPECCLDSRCLTNVVRDPKWTKVDFEAERAKRQAREAEIKARKPVRQDVFLAREEESKPLRERATAACNALAATLGITGDEHHLLPILEPWRILRPIANYTGDRDALNAQLNELASAEEALRDFWNKPLPGEGGRS